MGCNYKINGSVTLRRSQGVDVLLEALRERLDDGAVEVEELDENTIDLALNFDDATTIHTPLAMADLFKQVEPFVIGAGSFDIETSGERWTEYVGTREEVAKARSASALNLIQEHIELLTAEDRTKLGGTGQVVKLQNALGALLGNILPPKAAELEDAQPGSLAYNWQRAKALLESLPAIEPRKTSTDAFESLDLNSTGDRRVSSSLRWLIWMRCGRGMVGPCRCNPRSQAGFGERNRSCCGTHNQG